MRMFKNNKGEVPQIPTSTATGNTLPPSIPNPSQTSTNPPAITQAAEPYVPLSQRPPEHHAETQPKPIAPQSAPNPAISSPVPESPKGNFPTVTKELSYKPETKTAPQEQAFFVRIDKFTQTKENFEKVNMKIEEMEKVLKSIELTQNEEQKEIAAWKEDVTEMKSYLSQIDKEMFNKI